MTQDQARKLLKAHRKLAELGMTPAAAELELLSNLDRIAAEDPERVATEIHAAAPEDWKSADATGGASGDSDVFARIRAEGLAKRQEEKRRKQSADERMKSLTGDGYGPVAEGRAMGQRATRGPDPVAFK